MSQHDYAEIVKRDPPSDTGIIRNVFHQIDETTWMVLAQFKKREGCVVSVRCDDPQPGFKIDIWVTRDGEIRGYAVESIIGMYHTASEYAFNLQMEAMNALKELDQASKNDPSYDEEYEDRMLELIPEFQQRIKEMEERSSWVHGATGMYELFVCEEAQKLLRYRTNVSTFLDWSNLSYDEKITTPGFDRRRHTHESIKAVEELVFAHLFDNSARREHAASCPSLGCKISGCWSTSTEAQLERINKHAKPEQFERRNGKRETDSGHGEPTYNA